MSYILIKIIIPQLFGCIKDKFQNIAFGLMAIHIHMCMSGILLGNSFKKTTTANSDTSGKGDIGHQCGRGMRKTFTVYLSFFIVWFLFNHVNMDGFHQFSCYDFINDSNNYTVFTYTHHHHYTSLHFTQLRFKVTDDREH